MRNVLVWLLTLGIMQSAFAQSKYEVLKQIHLDLQSDGSTSSKTLDLNLAQNDGDYRGRCYNRNNPNKSLGMILSIRPFVDDINGPVFTKKGFRAVMIYNTSGPQSTDQITKDEIDSLLAKLNNVALDDAKIRLVNPRYAEFTVELDPYSTQKSTAIMLKSSTDGNLYVSSYRQGFGADQSCYFWEKRNP